MVLHELAELFDGDSNSNGEGSSDYSEKAKDVTVLQSFEDKVKDLQTVMETEQKIITPEEFHEKLVSMPEPETVKKAREDYQKTGAFDPNDLQKILGDPNKSVTVGPKPNDEENELIRTALESALITPVVKSEPEPDVNFDVDFNEESPEEEHIPEEDVEAQVDADIAKAAAAQSKAQSEIEINKEALNLAADDYPPWEEPVIKENKPIDYEKMSVAEQVKSGLQDSIAFSQEKLSLKTTIVEKEPVVQSVIQPVLQPVVPSDNPFSLQGVDLLMFTEIRNKYPYFTVYTDSMAWRDFYIYKIRILYDMLFRFPFLNTVDIREEMGKMKINHYVGDDAVSLDLLRRRLDDSVRWRTRLSSVLFGAIAQYYSWERALEMLRGKAYAEHQSKGAYKRDGLAGDHLREVELYVSDLHGILEAGKHLDSILKSNGDSLSRQIACIQLREATGFMDNQNNVRDMARQELNSAKRTLASIDDLDTLASEKSTHVPKPSGAVTPIDFGINVEPDEISGLGVE